MHKMRRSDRLMDSKKAMEILTKAEYGIMSTADKNGMPYAVPLSFIVHNGRICFHCALAGRKIDNIKVNPNVTFTVTGKTCPVYDNAFSTYFESVMISGIVTEIIDPEEKTLLLNELALKYLPEHMDKADADIKKSLGVTAVYVISIDEISGKEKKK